MVAGGAMHKVCQLRTALPGIEAVILESSRQFPRHTHDQFGVGVIHAGSHRSWSDIGWVDAGPGDIIMVNPGEMHDGICLDQEPRSWKMIYFDPEIASRIVVEDEIPALGALRPTVCDRKQARRFERLFIALTEPQPDSLHVDEELVLALGYAFRHHSRRRQVRIASLPGIQQIIELIDHEPQNPLSLQAMADMACVSRFHFLRAFFRTTGATPHAYILQRRVCLARKLIAVGEELTQASARAGFADQSHLTRAFVRQLGVTPASYRRFVAEPKTRAISFKTANLSPSTI
jgi:AraC-like DNA-binding protein